MTEAMLTQLEGWIRDNARRLAAEIVDPYEIIGTSPAWDDYNVFHRCVVEPAMEDRVRISLDHPALCLKARVFFSHMELREEDERAFRQTVSARLQQLGDSVMEGWRQQHRGR